MKPWEADKPQSDEQQAEQIGQCVAHDTQRAIHGHDARSIGTVRKIQSRRNIRNREGPIIRPTVLVHGEDQRIVPAGPCGLNVFGMHGRRRKRRDQSRPQFPMGTLVGSSGDLWGREYPTGASQASP